MCCLCSSEQLAYPFAACWPTTSQREKIVETFYANWRRAMGGGGGGGSTCSGAGDKTPGWWGGGCENHVVTCDQKWETVHISSHIHFLHCCLMKLIQNKPEGKYFRCSLCQFTHFNPYFHGQQKAWVEMWTKCHELPPSDSMSNKSIHHFAGSFLKRNVLRQPVGLS